MKQEKAILTRSDPVAFDGKKWTYEVKKFEVVVMARSGKYAMVKRPRCLPFVCLPSELGAA